MAIKNNMTAIAESTASIRSETSETSQGNAQQNVARSTSVRKNTFGTGMNVL